MEKSIYTPTIYACFIGYITQAIANNLAPLLFTIFMMNFKITTMQIAFLVSLNFIVQFCIDILASKYVDQIGYKTSIIFAHIFSFIGLSGLSIFPHILEPYFGLIIAVIIYALGSGLIEVLISPIVEACPTKHKESIMSLLHSFYCWGSVFVVLCSTIFIYLFGKENWYILPILWSLIPLGNFILFMKVPMPQLTSQEESMTLKELFSSKLFMILVILMIMSGACEHAMVQWSSTLCELGLSIPKVLGDLLGPCTFAFLMGLSRLFYGKFGEKVDLVKFIQLSACLCMVSYFLVSCIDNKIFNLIGCALCGLSVGIFWPGTFSIAAKSFPKGGTILFAYLALAGDSGCIIGPYIIGLASSFFDHSLKTGLMFGILFPFILFIFTLFYKKYRQAS